MPSFSISTELRIAPESFWERMSMSAVNAELSPLVRMTTPAGWTDRRLGRWTTGTVLFRSLVLLFGVVPVDVHSMRLERIDPGRGFVERSHSWLNAQWRHERSTAATAAGCVVTDRVTVEGRLSPLATLLMPVYRAVFRHRHRRLRILYGGAGG